MTQAAPWWSPLVPAWTVRMSVPRPPAKEEGSAARGRSTPSQEWVSVVRGMGAIPSHPFPTAGMGGRGKP